jgi:hypothetical protein
VSATDGRLQNQHSAATLPGIGSTVLRRTCAAENRLSWEPFCSLCVHSGIKAPCKRRQAGLNTLQTRDLCTTGAKVSCRLLVFASAWCFRQVCVRFLVCVRSDLASFCESPESDRQKTSLGTLGFPRWVFHVGLSSLGSPALGELRVACGGGTELRKPRRPKTRRNTGRNFFARQAKEQACDRARRNEQ